MSDAKRPVLCPNCGKRLSAPESYAGRKLKCPQCATTFACVFAAGAAPQPAATAGHPPSAFRMIEVEGEPKRGAAAEIGRLALGFGAAVVGAVIGLAAYGAVSLGIGYVIGLLGAAIIGVPAGLGMRFGYGRTNDFGAGVIAAMPAVGAMLLSYLVLTDGHTGRGMVYAIVAAAVIAGSIGGGIGLGGDD